ncbi:trans-sulfuration enzyme family protein [Vulgatibacter sp.]|uniref:trans-sulfuration enzyme family protein n=1 Tax=Vulgatibacter sp. TaxID=1971226 RepID=UPI0035642729
MRPHFETLAVHAGRDDLAALGVHAPPLDLSTTNPLSDPEAGGESLEAMALGGTPQGSAVYARLHNPTVARFESALAQLEQAKAAVAFGSGMAALSAALLAAQQRATKHVVAVRPLYGGSDHLLASGLLGTEVSWANPGTISQHVRPDTGLVLVETPANPTLDLLDIEDVVRQAGRVPVLVDSTFATPVLQQPLRHGATLVLHSATKYLGGHGDVLGGVIATADEEWAKLLRQVRIATGAVLHPLGGYLLHRGLQTLALRIHAAQANAEQIARRLADHPAIEVVHYPGLPGGDPKGLLGKQLAGPGAMLSFVLKGGYEAAVKLLGTVKLCTPAVSLGSADTLIQHPASMTHRVVDAAARDAHGITAGLVRLSVGVEHEADIWADLARALDRAGTP